MERLLARAALRRGTSGPAASLALLDQALGRLTETAPLRLYRGRYRLEVQDCAGARGDFTRAVELEPKSAIAQASLGTAAMCLGDTGLARRAFAASLRLDPNQPQLRQWMEQNPG
jgi:Flp pilus assembly protein TadD